MSTAFDRACQTFGPSIRASSDFVTNASYYYALLPYRLQTKRAMKLLEYRMTMKQDACLQYRKGSSCVVEVQWTKASFATFRTGLFAGLFPGLRIGAVYLLGLSDRSPAWRLNSTSLLTAVSVNSLPSQLLPYACAVHSGDFITVYRYAAKAGEFQTRCWDTD